MRRALLQRINSSIPSQYGSTLAFRNRSLERRAIRNKGQSLRYTNQAGIREAVVPYKFRTRLLNAMLDVPSPHVHFESHCNASRAAFLSHSSQGLIAEIQKFATEQGPGALLVTGLAVDPFLPATPATANRSTSKTSFVSEGYLTGVASLIGEPVAFASEKNGEFIHNICPVKHRENVQSNESSKIDLGLHVENAYFETRPDYLALICLRQDHDQEASTCIVDVRAVLSRMDSADRLQLQKPAFIVPSPPSHHEAMSGEKWSPPRPLFRNLEDPKFVCHFPGMKAIDKITQKALDKFEDIAQELKMDQPVALQPGSILLLNNQKVAHGRTPFIPRYDGTDRWLQRLYIGAQGGLTV